jgi:alpha-D-ribose 1-methylphosphonate 5-triphosphate synthase subunit PhnG
MESTQTSSEQVQERQVWMATLAKSAVAVLEERVASLGQLPQYRWLRPAEIGLVMVRGRLEGSGQPFNLGEIPISRCVVQMHHPQDDSVIAGFGYVAGRSRRHAELAALCDALLQLPSWRDRIQAEVIEPLQALAAQTQQTQQQQTAATQVNFFTLVRGE